MRTTADCGEAMGLLAAGRSFEFLTGANAYSPVALVLDDAAAKHYTVEHLDSIHYVLVFHAPVACVVSDALTLRTGDRISLERDEPEAPYHVTAAVAIIDETHLKLSIEGSTLTFHVQEFRDWLRRSGVEVTKL